MENVHLHHEIAACNSRRSEGRPVTEAIFRAQHLCFTCASDRKELNPVNYYAACKTFFLLPVLWSSAGRGGSYLWPPGIGALLSPLLMWWKQGRAFPNCLQHTWDQPLPLSKALLRIWGKGFWENASLSRCNPENYVADQAQACYRSYWLPPSLLRRWKLPCTHHPLHLLPASEMLEESTCPRPVPQWEGTFSLSQLAYKILISYVRPDHSESICSFQGNWVLTTYMYHDLPLWHRQDNNTTVLERIKLAVLWQQTTQDLRKWPTVQKGLSCGLCTDIQEIFWSCFCSVYFLELIY